jgi:hypothetical protein
MRSAIPFHVGRDSAKWSTIPVKTKMRTASQRNRGPLQTECWTASRGITGPLRPESAAWLTWFADIALEAQRRTITQVEFLIAKTKLLDRLRGQINERQQKALVRMFREGPEGFDGGLSAGNYGTITGASPATTTRDLADLTEKGALVRTGERKHTRYVLNLPMRCCNGVTG